MMHFATLFDINYLSRGLALLNSLTKECKKHPFTLYILALDDEVITFFEKHVVENVQLISLNDIENKFKELLHAKGNRSKVEYYFTLSPYLPLYIIGAYPHIDQITTMDADLFFFSDPAQIFDNYPDASVLITPHNFSEKNKELEVWGKYNVSFQSFKNDTNGLKCLEDWRVKCLAWCYDELDLVNNRFADQKYLDGWETTFENVKSINLVGTGIAPWNITNYSFSISNKQFLVEGNPLIYFHFQHLRLFSKNFASHGLKRYNTRFHKIVNRIYHKYLIQIDKYWHLSAQRTVLRYNDDALQSLLKNIVKIDGYYYFNDFIILPVNIYQFLRKIKNLIPGTNGKFN